MLQGGFIEVHADEGPAPPAPADSSPEALAGTKSPTYRKTSEVEDRAGFNETLAMCRKRVAAVASPHQAAAMEAQALERLGS